MLGTICIKVMGAMQCLTLMDLQLGGRQSDRVEVYDSSRVYAVKGAWNKFSSTPKTPGRTLEGVLLPRDLKHRLTLARPEAGCSVWV